MNFLDYIITILLLFGFIRGIFKGLIVEVSSLISLIAGIYGAINFSYFIGKQLSQYVSWSENYITIISFAITFAGIVLVIRLFGKLFTKIADFAALGLLNKFLGGVFGALKFALILSVIFLVYAKLNQKITVKTEKPLESGLLYQPIKNLAPLLFPNYITVFDE